MQAIRRMCDDRGASAVEYSLIVALAGAVVLVVALLGRTVASQFTGMTDCFTGSCAATAEEPSQVPPTSAAQLPTPAPSSAGPTAAPSTAPTAAPQATATSGNNGNGNDGTRGNGNGKGNQSGHDD